MRNYPKALKRKLLDIICQMREELPKYTTDPKRDLRRMFMKRCVPLEAVAEKVCDQSVIPPLIFQLPPEEGYSTLK